MGDFVSASVSHEYLRELKSKTKPPSDTKSLVSYFIYFKLKIYFVVSKSNKNMKNEI